LAEPADPVTGLPAQPFDATSKFLFEQDPGAWLTLGGLARPSRLELLDSDLSTVQARLDRVARVGGRSPYLAHVEFQASADREIEQRLLLYQALLHRRHRLPIESIVILLRRRADRPRLSGEYILSRTGDAPLLTLHYRVVRVWELPPDQLLSGALTWLPLVPLSQLRRGELRALLRAVEARLWAELPEAVAQEYWTAVYWLTGLRYTEAVAAELFAGVRAVRESATYQAAVREGIALGEARGRTAGQVEEARRLLVALGTERFGRPDQRVQAWLTAPRELGQLEAVLRRLVQVTSWSELIEG
jgi:predicted transposase YdaD